MLNKLQKTKDQQGFTIIEVMIVLAIAALILLIVLLAVPALQRTSRNTTIKNDAASVAGGINTFESDNNGATPTSVSGTGTVAISGGTGTTAESINVNGSTKVVALGTTNFSVDLGGVVPAADGSTSTIYSEPGFTCDSSTTAPGAASLASSRSVALYYLVETTSGNVLNCVSS